MWRVRTRQGVGDPCPHERHAEREGSPSPTWSLPFDHPTLPADRGQGCRLVGHLHAPPGGSQEPTQGSRRDPPSGSHPSPVRPIRSLWDTLWTGSREGEHRETLVL